ncbi:MAG: T9SS type A sorting domain-containing protein [Bacteroidia bacterium]|nr:T9SS type A sorting domain-containing protein [Bacteroidia bacterium]
MKTLTCLGTFALLWAQQINLNNLQLRLNRPIRKIPLTYNGAALRTQSLGWLLPNQDYAIVPSTTNDPDYAGDTLISNGTGPNTRTNPPAACVGTFFDSLQVALAFLGESNERFQVAEISAPLFLYTDGTIAERYDISPDLNGTNRTVSIKGVAALILNFGSGNGCSPTLSAPTPDSLGDGGYTLFYQLRQVRPYTWSTPFYSSSKPGTIPSNTAIRSTSKTIGDVRLANILLNETGPQCPSPQNGQLIEIFDFAYFSTPLDITDSASYYVVLGSERYNLRNYYLSDTLYYFIGPSFSAFDPPSVPLSQHPCFTGDTALIGRSLLSWAIYDTSNGNYFNQLSSINPTLPDWIPTHVFPSIKDGLNWVLFPIVYSQDITTGVWIHSNAQKIMTPYPNPTTDCFHLRFDSRQPTEVRAYLYTMDGRLVKVWPPQPISAGESRISLDVHDVPTGTYLMRVESALGRSAFQVTILH